MSVVPFALVAPIDWAALVELVQVVRRAVEQTVRVVTVVSFAPAGWAAPVELAPVAWQVRQTAQVVAAAPADPDVPFPPAQAVR